ncbi:hypothetical protein M0Q50_09310 [bacterium]|jgi:hypothetical protein|nr:hypothetical protein [bacterium]
MENYYNILQSIGRFNRDSSNMVIKYTYKDYENMMKTELRKKKLESLWKS